MKGIVLLLAFVFFAVPGCRAEENSGPSLETLVISKADGQQVKLQIEMAETPEDRTIGLMFRKSMPEDHGMLFMFEAEEERSFWMRNTFIPLDMVFIRKNGVIHSIHANAVPHDETPVPSRGPAIAVLEINGGRAAALNLKPGDVVHHSVFGNALAVPAAMD